MIEAPAELWTDGELAIAREAFDRAYARAVAELVIAVRDRCTGLSSVDTVWDLHDFLSIQRHVMEGRFDFRLEGILFVFASLVKDELLQLDELSGLEAEKLAKIAAMARF